MIRLKKLNLHYLDISQVNTSLNHPIDCKMELSLELLLKCIKMMVFSDLQVLKLQKQLKLITKFSVMHIPSILKILKKESPEYYMEDIQEILMLEETLGF